MPAKPQHKVAMAVAAHPDDIEFMMSGTMILLREAGYELHYLNVANGCCGSVTLSGPEIAAIRTEEAREAAALIGAKFYPPLVDDIDIFYEKPLLAKLSAIIRKVNPQILLLPSPQDYMEDHMNTSRLGVTAAFCRNMKNYPTDPSTPPVESEMCLYHALPMGLIDQLRNPILPDYIIDISSVMYKKRKMLSCHRSQKQWLDESQGVDNYIHMMEDMTEKVGRLSGLVRFGEGWRRHSHMGFGPEDFDPLRNILSNYVFPIKKGGR